MRAVVLVIDSFGIGALPDAGEYNDAGANTALHICEQVPGENWPVLKKWGLGYASRLLGPDLPGCEAVEGPEASFGVMAEASPGKDTTTGHWELAGLILDKAFYVFPQEYPSFPEELLKPFRERTGRGVIGNKAASGTAIINELGDEHRRTGDLICYTSADSVFQIAAHTDVVPLEELYRACEIARELCDPYQIGRVIARPFTGESGNYTRTKERKDFSIALPGESLLDHLQKQGVATAAVGKIGSIFNEGGIGRSYHDPGNPACLERTEKLLAEKAERDQFIFVNLVDTDMVYGHRRDPEGYSRAVAEIDSRLEGFAAALEEGDLLVITGDHGCDPTHHGSDHTREYVPLLVYQKGAAGENLGIRSSFTDLAQSLAEALGVSPMEKGKSFYRKS